MEQIKEAVYLINDERYLHLRKNGAGVGLEESRELLKYQKLSYHLWQFFM